MLWASIVVPMDTFLARVVGTCSAQVLPGISRPDVTFGAIGLSIGMALPAVRANALLSGVFLVIEFAVALAVFNALIAQMMFAARLCYSFPGGRLFPARINHPLARVHASSGAPRVATLTVGLLSIGCCLVHEQVLLMMLSGVVAYGLALVSAVVLIGRIRGLTGGSGCWR